MWLDASAVRMGTQEDCELRLPLFCAEGRRTASLVAAFRLRGNAPILLAHSATSVTLDGKELAVGSEYALSSDETGSPSVACVGDFYAFAVRRRGRFAVRLRHLIPSVPPVQEVDE